MTPPILSYADPHASESLRAASRLRLYCWTFLVLTLLAVITCARIEITNARAGFYLPRDFVADPGPWRAVPAWHDESIWRVGKARETHDETWTDRVLAPAEHATMLSATAKARARDDLRELLETWGLLQYPLTLLILIPLLLMSFRAPTRYWTIIMRAALVADLACITFMFCRSYMTSLGW